MIISKKSVLMNANILSSRKNEFKVSFFCEDTLFSCHNKIIV